MKIPKTHFFVQTHQTVIGQNSEMADMDNPCGDVFGYTAYMVAETETGSRFLNNKVYVTDRYETVAEEAMEAKMPELMKDYILSDKSNWEETDPRYGSERYEQVGHAWERHES